jgi:hypothetical protein
MFSSTLKIEAICSSEESSASQTTRRHIPEDDTLNIFNGSQALTSEQTVKQIGLWRISTFLQRFLFIAPEVLLFHTFAADC